MANDSLPKHAVGEQWGNIQAAWIFGADARAVAVPSGAAQRTATQRIEVPTSKAGVTCVLLPGGGPYLLIDNYTANSV
jgi:hypothetical protein